MMSMTIVITMRVVVAVSAASMVTPLINDHYGMRRLHENIPGRLYDIFARPAPTMGGSRGDSIVSVTVMTSWGQSIVRHAQFVVAVVIW